MPRRYPSEPPTRDAGAERVVWEALRDQLPDDAVLFSGVGLQDDAVEREIDLLVAWPGVGFAAIEVKGGYVTRDHEGWWQGGRANRHRIDPVHQVQTARHVACSNGTAWGRHARISSTWSRYRTAPCLPALRCRGLRSNGSAGRPRIGDWRMRWCGRRVRRPEPS